VTARDWLHFIISLLCHDIGYVRGICRGDGDGSYVTNLAGDKVTLPEGATDASMTPYHVARSQLFVRERSAKVLIPLDTAAIEANIEHTRFPVPEDEQHEPTDDFPGLVRAKADCSFTKCGRRDKNHVRRHVDHRRQRGLLASAVLH
jgi:hypothetical protein